MNFKYDFPYLKTPIIKLNNIKFNIPPLYESRLYKIQNFYNI